MTDRPVSLNPLSFTPIAESGWRIWVCELDQLSYIERGEPRFTACPVAGWLTFEANYQPSDRQGYSVTKIEPAIWWRKLSNEAGHPYPVSALEDADTSAIVQGPGQPQPDLNKLLSEARRSLAQARWDRYKDEPDPEKRAFAHATEEELAGLRSTNSEVREKARRTISEQYGHA